VRLGGVVERRAHPSLSRPAAVRWTPDAGGQPRRPASVRHQLCVPGADEQFYPEGVGAWLAKLAKLDVDPQGGISLDQWFFAHGEEVHGLRVHRVRPQGGNASSDSYCYR
jgi:selenium-binding protein 1